MNKPPRMRPGSIYGRVGIMPPSQDTANKQSGALSVAQGEVEKERGRAKVAEAEALKTKNELAAAQLTLTQLQQELKKVRTTLEGTLAQRNQEIVQLKKDRAAATKSKDGANSAAKKVTSERDAAIKERDTALAARDTAIQERKKVEGTLSAEQADRAELVKDTNDLVDAITEVIAALPPEQLTPELEQYLNQLVVRIAALEQTQNS